MNEDNKLYKKVGRKYEPVGMFYHRDYLTDGLWYVRSNGSKITNGKYLEGLFKLCDKPLFDNFKDYCDLHDTAESVMDDKEFRAFLDRCEKEKKGWSINDIVHMTLAVLKNKAKNS